MGIAVQANTSLQRNLQPIQRDESSSIGKFFSSAWQIPMRILSSAYSLAPCDKSTEALRRINEAADRGLQRAKTRGVQLQPIAPDLHGQLDQLLNQNGVGPAAIRQTAEIGEIASLGNLPPDPEVTRAPLLQDRVDATDYWKDQISLRKEDLKNQLSIFTALVQMRKRCGFPEDNLQIMALVKQAANGSNTVWELFIKHCQDKLTFFGKLKAAWYYWIYYQTSLIHNTIEAYLGSFIDRVTENLTKKSDETRTKIFRSLITNANQFLLEDLRATKDFAYEKKHGDLEKLRNQAIERHYGFHLKRLCEAFSEVWTDKLSPKVSFFKDLKEIPLIGLVFEAFEYLLNRLIIERVMIHSVLPLSLESAIKKGLEATQPEKLPFAISLTQFFTSQFEKLRTIVENERFSPSNNAENPPGTENLGSTVKLLLNALELEGDSTQGDSTPLELRKKLAKIEADKKGLLSLVSPDIASRIEQEIIASGNLLFWYLHKTAESGELFARLLELSLAPFSSKAKDEASLRAEFEEERLKFERTGEAVFKKLVRKNISKLFTASPTEPTKLAAKQYHDAQKIVVGDLVEKICDLSTQMHEKIEQSQETPTEENSVKNDIATLFQISQVLGSRKELQEEVDDLGFITRKEIRRSLNPILKSLEKIQARMLNLQEAQDHYPAHASVALNLNEIQTRLTIIQQQSHTQQRNHPNPLIQPLEERIEEISKCLGAQAPLVLKLKRFIAEILKLSTTIAEEQQAVDAIHALYPPQYEEGHDEPQGLLDQLLNYERGVYPRGFKPRACLEEIDKYLVHLPDEEQRELKTLIGKGFNLSANWENLKQALQRIYTGHIFKKTRDQAQLTQNLDTARAWLQNKILNYNFVKEEDHKKMRFEMKAITNEIQTLRKKSQKFQSDLTVPISDRIWKAASVIIPVAVTAWRGPVLGAVAAFGGGTSLKFMQGGESNWSEIGLKTALAGLSAGLSWWKAPFVGAAMDAVTTATYALAGWTTLEAIQTPLKNKSFNEVWKILSKGYKFSLKPRIYKAATTRALQAMIETN